MQTNDWKCLYAYAWLSSTAEGRTDWLSEWLVDWLTPALHALAAWQDTTPPWRPAPQPQFPNSASHFSSLPRLVASPLGVCNHSTAITKIRSCRLTFVDFMRFVCMYIYTYVHHIHYVCVFVRLLLRLFQLKTSISALLQNLRRIVVCSRICMCSRRLRLQLLALSTSSRAAGACYLFRNLEMCFTWLRARAYQVNGVKSPTMYNT